MAGCSLPRVVGWLTLALILIVAGCRSPNAATGGEGTAIVNEAKPQGQPTRSTNQATTPTSKATSGLQPTNAGATAYPPAGSTQATQASSVTDQKIILRVWVPPQFDPQADTPAGKIMQARLDEFTNRRPGVQVEVRVKAEQGAGGLYDSLSTTSAAAQGAMPDLVALPQPVFQTAAMKGLLRPMDGLSSALDDADWYDYARQLSHLQSGKYPATAVFGLPFAGDLLAQAVHTAKVPNPANNWTSLIEQASPLSFPAADQTGLFTLALYQSSGGELYKEQDRPALQIEPLSQVLTFYQQANQAGVMPGWLTQYQDYPSIWALFQQNQDGNLASDQPAPDMAVTWASQYLNGLDSSTAITETRLAPLPTVDGKAFTLGTGWSWALTATDKERQLVAVELAEFLTESDFLAQWTQAAGLLPPRPSALAAWQASDSKNLLAELSAAARLLPSTDVLSSLGPLLQEATLLMLNGQSDPQTAAQNAVNRLERP